MCIPGSYLNLAYSLDLWTECSERTWKSMGRIPLQGNRCFIHELICVHLFAYSESNHGYHCTLYLPRIITMLVLYFISVCGEDLWDYKNFPFYHRRYHVRNFHCTQKSSVISNEYFTTIIVCISPLRDLVLQASSFHHIQNFYWSITTKKKSITLKFNGNIKSPWNNILRTKLFKRMSAHSYIQTLHPFSRVPLHIIITISYLVRDCFLKN